MTADDIARDYPYLSQAEQSAALEISNTCDALMKLVSDQGTYANADARKGLCMQVTSLRFSAISMLGSQ